MSIVSALNTLFVTLDEASVGIEGDTLLVRVERERRLQIPILHLSSLVVFGAAYVSPAAMHALAASGATVVFLNHSGRFLARVEGPVTMTATLRRAQYRTDDDVTRRLPFARAFVTAKIANHRSILLRGARASEQVDFSRSVERLKTLAEKAMNCDEPETLLGIEGEAASRYFSHFDDLLSGTSFRFESRSRRPPLNAVNALLSFGYALLSADCQAALTAVGLDPCVGLFHRERPGRPALALDLMEELRGPVVDRMVLAMLRLGQVKKSDFEVLETGEHRMKEEFRRGFLNEYQTRKRDTLQHPASQDEVPWGLLPHLQARILARALRSDDAYLPFLLR